jgi:site-specific DNA recombinase
VKRIITRKAADDETIQSVVVPAIVTVNLWEAAQEQLAENKRKFMHPPVHDYLLRGRLRCALCGKAMIGHGIKHHTKTGESWYYRYYECPNSRVAFRTEVKHCNSKNLRADFAEAAVWNSIRDAMLEPDRLWADMHKSNEENQKTRRLLEQAIAAEHAEIDKVHIKEERLLDLYESGDITKDRYRTRKMEYQAEIDKHDEEKKKLADRLGECAVLTLEQEGTLQHFQNEIASRMTDDVSAVDRMQLYDILRVECVYNAKTGELLISGLFGEATAHATRESSGRSVPPPDRFLPPGDCCRPIDQSV